jgi:hypothetical protein
MKSRQQPSQKPTANAVDRKSYKEDKNKQPPTEPHSDYQTQKNTTQV